MVAVLRSCCFPEAKSSFLFIGAACTSALSGAAAVIAYLGQTPAYALGQSCADYTYTSARNIICEELSSSLALCNRSALVFGVAAAVLGTSTVLTWACCPSNKPREYEQVSANEATNEY